MKKIIGASLALVLSAASFAQGNDQIQNKNGVDIMPVSGEIGIGMNAIPVMNYLGNMFGYTGSNTSLSGNKFISYFSGNTLFGKYMLSNDNAVRGHLRIGQFNNVYENMVFDDTQNDPDALVYDSYTTRSSFYNLGVGYEFRRGKTRLRGIYGGEILYSFVRGTSNDYSYGNAYGLGNPAPTATSWFNWGGVAGEGPTAERALTSWGGNYNGLGIRAFAGVEYYIAPKICIGTEFGWGITAGMTSESTTRTEYWDPTANGTGAVAWRDVTTAGSKGIGIDTDNFGGALYFMFWF